MAYRYILVVISISLVLQITNSQNFVKFFRKDYTYMEETRSFYKIHTIHKTWEDAKIQCEREWATLFYPQDDVEADAVLNFWNKTQPFAWVFIGVSDSVVKGVFESVDGHPIIDIYHNWGPGEPNDANGEEGCVILRKDGTLNDDGCFKKYPYICKKSLSSLDWNIPCGFPDTDYKFNEYLGRCYKFHLKPANWSEAYSICSAEESYLAVINSQAEADHLVNITNEAPKDGVTGDYLRGAVILGFENRDGNGWKTVRGRKPLEKSGYAKWSYLQPDGGANECCGSMFYDGFLNDIGCHHKSFFICEHEVEHLMADIEERFDSDD